MFCTTTCGKTRFLLGPTYNLSARETWTDGSTIPLYKKKRINFKYFFPSSSSSSSSSSPIGYLSSEQQERPLREGNAGWHKFNRKFSYWDEIREMQLVNFPPLFSLSLRHWWALGDSCYYCKRSDSGEVAPSAPSANAPYMALAVALTFFCQVFFSSEEKER